MSSADILVTPHRGRNILIQIALDILTKNPEVILLALVLWLYKELRGEVTDKTKVLAGRIEKALEVYADLELALKGYITDGTSLPTVVDPKLVKAYPFLPRALCTTLSEWREDADREAAHAIVQSIRLEIDRLKGYQMDEVSYASAPTPSEFIARLYHTGLKNLIEPAVHAVAAFVLIGLGTLWVVGFIQAFTSRARIITYTAGTIGVVLWGELAVFTVDLFVERRFRHDWGNWAGFILLLLMPTAAAVKLPLWQYGMLGIAILYAVLFARRMIKRL